MPTAAELAALCALLAAAGEFNFPGAGMPEPALALGPPGLAGLASSLLVFTSSRPRGPGSCDEMLVCLKEIPLLDLRTSTIQVKMVS